MTTTLPTITSGTEKQNAFATGIRQSVVDVIEGLRDESPEMVDYALGLVAEKDQHGFWVNRSYQRPDSVSDGQLVESFIAKTCEAFDI